MIISIFYIYIIRGRSSIYTLLHGGRSIHREKDENTLSGCQCSSTLADGRKKTPLVSSSFFIFFLLLLPTPMYFFFFFSFSSCPWAEGVFSWRRRRQRRQKLFVPRYSERPHSVMRDRALPPVYQSVPSDAGCWLISRRYHHGQVYTPAWRIRQQQQRQQERGDWKTWADSKVRARADTRRGEKEFSTSVRFDRSTCVLLVCTLHRDGVKRQSNLYC